MSPCDALEKNFHTKQKKKKIVYNSKTKKKKKWKKRGVAGFVLLGLPLPILR
jgi:hypothetical protein